MITFCGRKTPGATTIAQEEDTLQLCPRCTFPNTNSARICVDCGYSLENTKAPRVLAKKIKLCTNPNCGAFNKAKNGYCSECKSPFVEFVDKNTVREKERREYIRICPKCKTHNPANASICVNPSCQLDIEDVDAILVDGPHPGHITFHSIRNNRVFEFDLNPSEELLFGNEHNLSDDIIKNRYYYVSRLHFVLSYHNSNYWITDKSTNGTFLDGSRLEKDVEFKLASETVIGLGDPSMSELQAAFYKVTF